MADHPLVPEEIKSYMLRHQVTSLNPSNEILDRAYFKQRPQLSA